MADKKKIYLFCSAGMSTSMLAANMQQSADAHKLPIEVKAFPINKVVDIASEERPACVLLGPQAGYQLEETKAALDPMGIPCAVIDQQLYGMMDGEGVLKAAIKVIKANK